MVSIHRPLSYEPSTLPLRHAAFNHITIKDIIKHYFYNVNFKFKQQTNPNKGKNALYKNYLLESI